MSKTARPPFQGGEGGGSNSQPTAIFSAFCLGVNSHDCRKICGVILVDFVVYQKQESGNQILVG
jgi:hypothetical protein